MSGEWHRMSALALGAGIEGGAIDPRALTEFFLERIEEVDGDRAIYLRITAARARFALPTTLVWASLDPGVDAPARSAVERLRAAGCAIDETPVPEFNTVEELVSRFGAYHSAECHALWYDVIEARPDLIYAPIWERIRVGAQISATDAARAKQGLAAGCCLPPHQNAAARRFPHANSGGKPPAHRRARSRHRDLQDGQCCGASQHAPRQLPQLLRTDAPLRARPEWRAGRIDADGPVRGGGGVCCA